MIETILTASLLMVELMVKQVVEKMVEKDRGPFNLHQHITPGTGRKLHRMLGKTSTQV
jgi:hypothetical protein